MDFRVDMNFEEGKIMAAAALKQKWELWLFWAFWLSYAMLAAFYGVMFYSDPSYIDPGYGMQWRIGWAVALMPYAIWTISGRRSAFAKSGTGIWANTWMFICAIYGANIVRLAYDLGARSV